MSTHIANPLELEGALIRRYPLGGPSYTSYPAVVRFQPEFDVKQYLQSLRQQCSSIAPLSLCVSVPPGRCQHRYAEAAHEVIAIESNKQDYLHYLAIELELQAELFDSRRPVTQLHWSGTMAAYLAPAEMTELMHRSASHFNLLDTPSRDYSIEIAPSSTSKEMLALLKGLGFNHIRVAINVFGDTRRQLKAIRELANMVRNYAFDTLSFDVSYTQQEQSIDAFQQTLTQIIALQPDRIVLQDAAQSNLAAAVAPTGAREKFCGGQRQQSLHIMASQLITSHGYVLIGMHCFVRAYDALHEVQQAAELRRNLLGYCATFADDLVGVGLSALSKVGVFYTKNTARAKNYYLRLRHRELPIAHGLRLSEDDQLRYYVIMQIACNLRLDFDTLQQRFDVMFLQYFSDVLPELRQMHADRLLNISNDELRVTNTGRPLLRNICMLFDTGSTPVQAALQSRMV